MFKFNSGNGAIICDKCRVIICENVSITDYHFIENEDDLCPKCSGIDVTLKPPCSCQLCKNPINEFDFYTRTPYGKILCESCSN